MYINNEKDLEDYICDHIDEFIIFLKSIYGENKDIEFVGRQIVIGDSRLDLLFQIETMIPEPYVELEKTFIVVELKFRDAQPKDIAQLTRYMNLLYDLEFDERIGGAEVSVNGLLLTMGLDSEMQEMQMYLSDRSSTNITFAKINTKVNYRVDSYCRKEEFIEKMSVDSRLKKVKEAKECGEEAND